MTKVGYRFFVSFLMVLSLAWMNGMLDIPAAGARPQASARATFYVSTDGNDKWSGKLPAPNREKTDGPFANLTRARDAIRKLKTEQARKDSLTVMVRGGKYYLDDTVQFGPEDSGSRDHPITYQAYPGEKPVLSGGRRVMGWKPYQGKILVAPLPGSKGGKWKFRQLFLNGQRQIRARTPDFDADDPMYGGWAFMEGPAEEGTIVSFSTQRGSIDAFKYRPGTFQRHWAKASEGEVVFIQGTGQMRSTVPIKSVDEKERVITLTRPGYQFDVVPWYQPMPFLPNNPFYVTNLLEELDQPGEWCLDSEDGLLYFWPPTGSLQASDEVVVPALFYLVAIREASWLRLSGFTFTETMDGDNYHHEGVEGAGAMYPQAGWRYAGDALHMKGAEHCTIDRNRFYAVGGNAIYLEGHNARNVIRYNEISYAGADGICLLGTKLKHPIFNQVSDNYIHHIGVLNKYVAGIFTGMSSGNVLSHNRIEYVPHHAINLSNNPSGRNIVEFNLIRHACQEISDTGAINSWMETPASQDAERVGHVIRYNYISDTFSFNAEDGKVGKEKGRARGIYLDNYTSNSFVYGNIVVRCQSGILLHAGKNNLVENNIFVNCLNNVALVDAVSEASTIYPYWKDMKSFYRGNHVLRNIFYQSEPAASLYSLHIGWTDQTLAQSNHNLFFQGAQGRYALQDNRRVGEGEKITAFEQWQRLGYEADSVIADPMFVDAAQDDYRLKPDSPALKLGFVPIDISRIGPRDLQSPAQSSGR